MKNKNNISKWLIIIGLLSSGINSCQKSSNDLVPVKNELKAEVQNLESTKLFKNSNGSITYSETYKLLSFTGIKSKGDAYNNIYVDFEWSAVGEKDVTSYEIEVSYGGYYIPGEVMALSYPSDSLTYHSQRIGFSYPRGGTANCIARLKITLTDNRVIYSNNYSFSFRGKGSW